MLIIEEKLARFA